MSRYSEELAWCISMLQGDTKKVRMVGAGNESDYLDVQAIGARRAGYQRESIAFQAASNHWRDGSHARAIELLREALSE